MIEKIIIFILFLGPLIFFHELGHYLFARLFGVRVEVFSIGFGPKFLKWKWGETEWTISAIPLGGYVKMSGDNILERDEVPLSERAHSFNHKGKWPRFWIVFGGPLANFVLTWAIFFGLTFFGEKTPEIRLGLVSPESFFYSQGLRSGDVLKKVNDTVISHPSDLPTPGDGTIHKLDVLRWGKVQTVKVDFLAKKFFEEFQKHPPYLRKPLVTNTGGERFLLSLYPDKIDNNRSLGELGHYSSGQRIYFFKIEMQEGRPSVVAKKPIFDLKNDTSSMEGFLKWLANNEMRPIELMVANIQEGGGIGQSGDSKRGCYCSL